MTHYVHEYTATMRDHYVEAMLWASTSDEEGTGTAGDELAITDLSTTVALEVNRDVSAFLAKPILPDMPGARTVFDVLTELDINPEQAGHDLALTRNGHGAGFWDRGHGELGELLSNVAREMGESSWWVDGDVAETF